MSKTIIGLNDAKAVKRYSAFLAVDVGRKSYFNKKFMGVGVEAQTPIQMLPQLENEAGDQITYDLVMQLKMQPVEGDNTLEGRKRTSSSTRTTSTSTKPVAASTPAAA